MYSPRKLLTKNNNIRKYSIILHLPDPKARNKNIVRFIEMKSIHTSWANIAEYFVISTLLPSTYQTNR